MTKYISLAAVAAATLALGVSGACADNPATGSLTVTANLPKNCTVNTSSLAFGDITGIDSADKTGAGSINVTCTAGTVYDINFTGGSGTSRSLKGQTVTPQPSLTYNLYQDAAATTTKWGTDVGGADLPGQTASSVPVYGRITTNAGAVSDNYLDTVTISVSY